VLHILIIAMFMVIVLHDSFEGASRSSTSASLIGSGWVWLASLGPMLVLAGATWLIIATLARDVQRRGSIRSAILGERMLGASRWIAVILHACNVLVIGLLDEVRRLIGDIIAIDELAVITLPIGVFLVGWWAYEPIERRLRESTTLRLLDAGQPVFAPPTRRQYVILNLRHQVLLSLVPIGLIAVWTESLERVLSWVGSHKGAPGWLGWLAVHASDKEKMGLAYTGLQLAGVAVVFALSPVVLRRVWDTVRLAPGPLRNRLVAICTRSGVSVRDLLVWRTHGTMINGAVIGLVGPLRYILLTDALLEHLPARQVEAVMAHEVGHARHRHMPWLAMSMLTGITVALMVLSLGAWAALQLLARTGRAGFADALNNSLTLDGLLVMGSLVLGLGWFGFVSRRFEWQADAFAVQQLSRSPAPPDSAGPTLWDVAPSPATVPDSPAEPDHVTHEAVAAMTGALQSVAELNHMSRDRRSWRHGSIAYRQRRLRSIVGQPLGRVRIDRTVRWLKRGLAAALVIMIGLSI
jgi:Zn-dependent protease with chaperone function